MDRRKKIIVNDYEESTELALNRIAKKQNARVFSKIRIADALEIAGSGLSAEEYSYALKAHFDFVFADASSKALFAVEFDEGHHFTDPKTIQRDKLKKRICEHLGLPILRIDKAYLSRVGQFATVLDWLIEMWFMEQEWVQKQRQGEISWDEDFLPFAVFEFGYIENGQFVPLNRDEFIIEDFKELKHQGKQLISRSYDPFIRHSAYVNHLAQKQVCSFPEVEILDLHDYTYGAALVWVKLANEQYVYGQARCLLTNFISTGLDMAWQLAMVDLAIKLRQQGGINHCCSLKELEAARRELRRK
jgi:hypothetical protein